jgi:alcohol dehydrogenase
MTASSPSAAARASTSARRRLHGRPDPPVWDFEDIGDWWTRASVEGIAPIVAVPTTAGTGSEVGRASVITNSDTHTKKVIFHPKFLPAVTICDPELTVGMPKSSRRHRHGRLRALPGSLFLALLPSDEPGHRARGHAAGEGISAARLWDGTDIEARTHMMSAAAMGAVAFQKGLGAIHSLSHPVGAIYNTHHGMTNAVVMPPVLRFNRPAIEEKLARPPPISALPAASTASTISC